MKQSSLLFGAALLGLLGGCAAPPARHLYDGPERPLSELAQIVKSDSFDATGNRLSYDWIAHVTAVDGKSTGQHGRSLVLPGRHTVSMLCEVHPRLQPTWQGRKREMTVTVKAGEVYHPWCDTGSKGQQMLCRSGVPNPLTGRPVPCEALPYLSTERAP
ncbi:MAG: hypothetical protein KBC73_20600 [Burkholderiaceae bacterium]|nr:hypothetical protein [Burkholderiaceae bacterium]